MSLKSRIRQVAAEEGKIGTHLYSLLPHNGANSLYEACVLGAHLPWQQSRGVSPSVGLDLDLQTHLDTCRHHDHCPMTFCKHTPNLEHTAAFHPRPLWLAWHVFDGSDMQSKTVDEPPCTFEDS